MYQLTAIFNRSCLKDVLQELFEREIEGVTVSSVIGKGGIGFIEEGGDIDLDEKVRVDIILSNELYKELAKEAIRSNAQDTGHGSGKMWVTPVLEVERIRTDAKQQMQEGHPRQLLYRHRHPRKLTAIRQGLSPCSLFLMHFDSSVVSFLLCLHKAES